MTHKYTTDGKKVVVIGNLNSQEIIVQEIFVTSDGAEIPSGEHFVVKSLHDKPVESWKVKDLLKFEQRYKNRKFQIENELKKLESGLRQSRAAAKLAFQTSRFCTEHMDNDAINTLLDFISGEITHVLIHRWDYEIKTFEDAFFEKDRYGNFGKPKLLTLFGYKPEEGFEWCINRYSDGSGGDTTITPHKSYDEAVSAMEKLIRDKILSNRVTESMVKAKEKYNLSVPSSDDLKAFYAEQIKAKQTYVDDAEKKLAKYQSEVSELQAKLA